MTDVFSPGKRSEIMRSVRGGGTTPERLVRALVFRMGLRYRLGGCGLPGKPDLVFPGRGRVIFVHGCFWHGHDCARGAREPKSNREYWVAKIARNMERDRRVVRELRRQDWKVLVVWECQLRHSRKLEARLNRFFRNRGAD
ncbi:MAG: Very short patch repair protein [Myxococcota bacterium]|nr:Very short patch repair protein [Myxococcota bacterium]